MKFRKSIFSLAAVALWLTGCAFTPVKPGMSREQVVASYGTPTRVVAIGSGTRMQYSSQPAGQSVVMIDLNPAGQVVAVREVMMLKELFKIVPGEWTREDVEREFGRPASIDRVASWPGEIMTYRWRDTAQDMYFWVYLDAANRVQRTGQGMEIQTRLFEKD